MESTHILLYVAFISCLLKPRNFLLALSFILVHFLFLDVVAADYTLLDVKLSPADWLLISSLIVFFFSTITILGKNFLVFVTFLTSFTIYSYIYVFEPNQVANFLWHGYGNYYYENLFSMNIGYWLGISPLIALVVENARSYTDFSVRLYDHIINSHRELFVYAKNEAMGFYTANKEILFDPYFKKDTEKAKN